jgi:hypothetical protein
LTEYGVNDSFLGRLKEIREERGKERQAQSSKLKVQSSRVKARSEGNNVQGS